MSRRFRVIATLLLVSLIGLAAMPAAFAQTGPVYNAGDRVEVDPFAYQMGSPYKRWYKATVKAVSGEGRNVFVLVDPVGGERAKEYTIGNSEAWIRPLRQTERNAAPPQQNNGQNQPPAANPRHQPTSAKSAEELEAEARKLDAEAERLLREAQAPATKTRGVANAAGAPAPVTVAKNPAGGGSARPGRYECAMSGAGYFNLRIIGPSRYATYYTGQAEKAGNYTNAGGRLAFTSGPIVGNYGAVLGREIGLSSRRETTMFYATCTPK
ncbi:MAG: hypothetical protein NVS3B7_07900 [Candidatus Elarobacter sp.]